MVATVVVLGGLGSVLAFIGGGDSPAQAQPIPCEQWQQMHPGWPCADVPTYNPQPTQPQNTGVPAPIIPSLLNPPTQQGGGPGAGALTPPPLQGPPNMNNPIVPVPGYVPPVLPGNEAPAAPQPMPDPASPLAPAPFSDGQPPAPETSGSPAPMSGSDLVSQLERATKLHEQGVLSDQEFSDLKQQLLHGNPPPSLIPLTTSSDPHQTPVDDDTDPKDSHDPRVELLALIGAVAFIGASGTPAGPNGVNRWLRGSGLIHAVDKNPNVFTGELYPGQPETRRVPRVGPHQPRSTTFTWTPDSPKSQEGNLHVKFHSGIDKGVSSGSTATVLVGDKPRTVYITETGNDDYEFDIPNVKSGEKVTIHQQVNFLAFPRGSSYTAYDAEFTPRQYPPPDKIEVLPDNKIKIYDGDPLAAEDHGSHGFNAKYPKPNKDVFPESWTSDDIANAAESIARNPTPYPNKPQLNGNYLVNGYANNGTGGLNINVVVAPNGQIVTAWPDPGPGVKWRRPDLTLQDNSR